MGNVFFKPWVGKEYGNPTAFPKKIMALGESHHCNDLDKKNCSLDKCLKQPIECQSFTQNVVKSYLSEQDTYERWYITFRKFEQALSGRKLKDEEREKYWNSLLFYNYTQVPMEHPNQRPNNEQIKYSERGFLEVLDQYKPEIIITWGRNIFDAISNSKKQIFVTINILDKVVKLPTFEFDLPGDKKCIVFPTYHPASPRFSPIYWNKIIKSFM